MWVGLVEKAYAQYVEQSGTTPGEAGQNADAYWAIAGGEGQGITAITGQATTIVGSLATSSSASSASSLLTQLQSSLAAGQDVIMGTNSATQGNLIGSHMYSVSSVNVSAGTVTLRNPWGANAAGAGVAENFTATISQLKSEGVSFLAATGTAAAA